jgi:hypothetical protein
MLNFDELHGMLDLDSQSNRLIQELDYLFKKVKSIILAFSWPIAKYANVCQIYFDLCFLQH